MAIVTAPANLTRLTGIILPMSHKDAGLHSNRTGGGPRSLPNRITFDTQAFETANPTVHPTDRADVSQY
ncbi:hypothetical protein GOEFS_012_00030 [Gordonia effusa NBRC 100432]|uniref:Uncharacterized protein n=1 Tax=Gordonia effusa NBRC 100432 TaxID=1077974 RepID=H0QV51_9ACTN|nr:hypothetical protein GOEFS_012_00030 [Gordonia effusa NBRC 100432]